MKDMESTSTVIRKWPFFRGGGAAGEGGMKHMGSTSAVTKSESQNLFIKVGARFPK